MDEHAPSIELQRNRVLSMVRAVLGEGALAQLGDEDPKIIALRAAIIRRRDAVGAA